jgi:hypothetical protein
MQYWLSSICRVSELGRGIFVDGVMEAERNRVIMITKWLPEDYSLAIMKDHDDISP